MADISGPPSLVWAQAAWGAAWLVVAALSAAQAVLGAIGPVPNLAAGLALEAAPSGGLSVEAALGTLTAVARVPALALAPTSAVPRAVAHTVARAVGHALRRVCRQTGHCASRWVCYCMHHCSHRRG